MNKTILKGQWNQMKGEVKKQWGKLTNDEIDQIEGEYDKMVGVLQEKYGYEKEKAQREANEFLENF